MKIRKVHLFIGIAIVLFLIGIPIALWIFSPFTTDSCVNNSFHEPCGLVTESEGTYLFSGVITAKEQKNNTYSLSFTTQNRKGKDETVELALPPQRLKVIVQNNNIESDLSQQIPINEYSSSDFYNVLNVPMDVLVSISVLSNDELSSLKEILGDDEYSICFTNNERLVQHLLHSNIFSKIRLMYDTYSKGCSGSAFNFVINQ